MGPSKQLSRLSCTCLLLGALLAGRPALAEDGQAVPAGILYEHRIPAARATVVLAHDWFGDSEYYRSFGDALRRRGYGVVATDLYGGKPGAKTHAEAWGLLKELTDEHAARVLRTAITEAANRTGIVFIVGFSAGVPHALRAAIAQAGLVDGIVVLYGDLEKEPAELSKLKGPVLAIYGSRDDTYGDVAAAAEAARFLAGADAAGIRAEAHVYSGAAHAFAQPLFNAGSTYDSNLAGAALELTFEFLARAERASMALQGPQT